MGVGAALAVSFLTIVPLRLRGEVPALGAAAGWFPFVGAAIGALAGAVGYLLEPTLGATVASILAVATLVVATGALHQDGLADCADGLGAHGDRDRRLAIMRDSSIGTFGALALGIWLLLLVAALSGLDRGDALPALIVTATSARWATLAHTALTPPARTDGLGAAFSVNGVALVVATACAAAIALALADIGAGAASLAAAGLVALVVTAWSRSTLGGRTGDTLGATVAIAEAAVLLTILGFA